MAKGKLDKDKNLTISLFKEHPNHKKEQIIAKLVTPQMKGLIVKSSLAYSKFIGEWAKRHQFTSEVKVTGGVKYSKDKESIIVHKIGDTWIAVLPQDESKKDDRKNWLYTASFKRIGNEQRLLFFELKSKKKLQSVKDKNIIFDALYKKIKASNTSASSKNSLTNVVTSVYFPKSNKAIFEAVQKGDNIDKLRQKAQQKLLKGEVISWALNKKENGQLLFNHAFFTYNNQGKADGVKITRTACFPAGTPIFYGLSEATGTPQYTPNEQVKTGDLLPSFDASTGKVTWKRVLGTTQSIAEELIKVYVQGKLALMPTPDHPFWIEGRWKSAVELTRGDSLWLYNGQKVAIDSTVRIDTVVQVYNFEVEDFHTYFVGEWGVGVHNSCINNNLANILCQIYGIQQPDDLAKALDKKFKTQLSKLENLLKDKNFQKAVLKGIPINKNTKARTDITRPGTYTTMSEREAFFWDFIWANKSGEVNFLQGFVNFDKIYQIYVPEGDKILPAIKKGNHFEYIIPAWTYLTGAPIIRTDYKNILITHYFLTRKGGIRDKWKNSSLLYQYQKGRASTPSASTVIPPMANFYQSSVFLLLLGNHSSKSIHRKTNSIKSKVNTMIGKPHQPIQYGIDWEIELTARLVLGGKVPNIKPVQLTDIGDFSGDLVDIEEWSNIKFFTGEVFKRKYDVVINTGLAEYKIDAKNTIHLDKSLNFVKQVISDIELAVIEVNAGRFQPNVHYIFKKRDGYTNKRDILAIAILRVANTLKSYDKNNNPVNSGVRSYTQFIKSRLELLGFGKRNLNTIEEMLLNFFRDKLFFVEN